MTGTVYVTRYEPLWKSSTLPRTAMSASSLSTMSTSNASPPSQRLLPYVSLLMMANAPTSPAAASTSESASGAGALSASHADASAAPGSTVSANGEHGSASPRPQ